MEVTTVDGPWLDGGTGEELILVPDADVDEVVGIGEELDED